MPLADRIADSPSHSLAATLLTRPRSAANRCLWCAAAALLLTGCEASTPEPAASPTATAAPAAAQPPGDTHDRVPYAGIGADEVVHFTGTEPFWGGQVMETTLTYSTPEAPDGTAIEVSRFAGRGGVAFSGVLEGAPFELTVSEASCSDGMSDRSYPFAATLKVGTETRRGCAWTDARPFSGPANP